VWASAVAVLALNLDAQFFELAAVDKDAVVAVTTLPTRVSSG
jgi:hypothetical protein